MRLKYVYNISFQFWTWNYKLGYNAEYYDGWNNYFNLGLFCISWMTPPLIGDHEKIK